MFVLVVVVLTLIYTIISDGVSFFIITLFSFGTTLSVSYNGNNGYNDLLIALGIKPGVCSLGGYGFDAYGFSV